MTREEAIEVLNMVEAHGLAEEAKQMAIQALSQEPCDDAISRILQRMWNCRGKHTTSIDKVAMEQIIRDELSVTQKSDEQLYKNGFADGYEQGHNDAEQKSGKWIGIDEKPHEDYECSCCGYVVSTFTANIEPHTEYKYCPNCGAKMGSEDKE